MNPYLQDLQPYPFEKLLQLKSGITPPEHLHHIALSIGEPKHAPHPATLETLQENIHQLASYPLTKGLPELRQSITRWLSTRFHIPEENLDPEKNVIPVAGTREALFSFVQACVTPSPAATVVMPNPFYQIYEGAALLSGAKPFFLNCVEQNNFIPRFQDVPERIWRDSSVLFICSPGNPTGSVINKGQMRELICLADQFDFIIASDECYSELYFDEHNPPPGLLQVCQEMGRDDFSRCVVFHSLSKRSNLPGLRSGFVAGDAEILKKYLQYRTYQGCALPVPTQLASITAWQDEGHVFENRQLYQKKFAAVIDILKDVLPVDMPEASFYLWLKTPIDDREFSQKLFAQQNITVLPGQFLGRPTAGGNPGKNRVRIALVATLEECVDAANRIKQFMQENHSSLHNASGVRR